MKKLIMAATTLAVFIAPHAWAGKSTIDIQSLSGLQQQFKDMSKELGLAIAYKPVSPAEPLGITGFDIGVELSVTDINDEAAYWKAATTDVPAMLPVPKFHVQKGLPLGIDIGGVYSKIPDSNVKLWGAEVKYAFLEGGIAAPAVAVRGTYTKLDGVENYDLNTKGIDVSISKGFAILTPYVGVGQVWIKSTASVTGLGLTEESFSATKVFGGFRMSLALFRLSAEAEISEVNTYTVKLSAGF